MADDKRDDRFGVADELRALGEVRSALEAVEREQNRVLEDRRGLRTRLEGLLEALREDALVLRFDTERELVEASGPSEEQLGVSAAELVSTFEEFADEETVEALDEANRAVLDEASSGASVSDGFLRTADEDLAVTWIHVRRWDEEGELNGTEVIGLVAPLAEPDDGLGAGGDPFENLLEHLSRRLLDDVGAASITRAVQMFGDFLSADRVVVNRYDDDARTFSVMSSWLRGDTQPLDAEVRGISISELPWAYSALGAGEAVVISAAADLPAEAAAERELYAGDDAKASLLVPMVRDDRLTGFLSIQSTRQERDWDESDISRAQQFAMPLSAALARAEAGEALAEARSDLEEASEKSASAEARAEEAEASASEAQQKLDDLVAEAETVRGRVREVEAELEVAKKSENEAREAADDARSELESARQEAEEARTEGADLQQEAEGARTELENLKDDAERAQRRSEDTAADALSVRTELADMREQAEEARSEAAEARAELRQLRDAGAASTDEVEASAPEPADVETDTPEPADVEIDTPEPETAATDSSKMAEPGGYDPDATVEMSLESFEREAFDPDATVKIELQSAASEETGEDEVFPEAAMGQEPEAETEEEGSETDEMLEHPPDGATPESGPSTWKTDKAGWEDSTDEVALPEFLENDDEDAESGDTDDVEAARRLARQVAGKDEGDADQADAEEMTELDTELPPVTLPDTIGEPTVPDAPADEPVAQVPDLAGIDAVVGLQDVGGNVELYRDLLTKFRNDYIGAAAKIDSALERGNIEVAHLLLHAVKGVAGLLGATGVRDAADDLETHLIGNDPANTKKAVEDFTAALDGVLDSIATLDSETVSSTPPMREPSTPSPEVHVSDPMVLRSYLSGLRQHLLAEKLRQCQLVMREITARNWPGDYNERVTLLAGFIGEERFDEARATFEELMDQFIED